MDATEQVAKFSEFFESLYYKDLLDAIAKGDKYLNIPFTELAKYHIQLAEDLLDDPENTLQAAKHTIEQMDLGGDNKGFEVRFQDLPKTSHIKVRNIRSKHIGKLLEMDGIVRQKSDVRPQVTSARFECPSCGNIIPVLQLDQKFREPHACSCGRKGQFRLIHKEMVDAQKIVLEEAPEDMDGGEQPKRLNIFLQNDLVSPISDKRTNPGSKIRLSGIVKEVPITLATGGKSVRFDLICECNYVEPVQEEFTNIIFTEEEIEQIKEIAKKSGSFELMMKSLAPTIYGHDKVKEALFLQLFAGVKKTSDDGVSRRGDIHILLIGDPGAGKSQLIKRMSVVAPKSRFVSGKGSSGAGLTAAVVKDEFLKGWALEAGALVLANKGMACTTEDAEFILENGARMSFKELFHHSKKDSINPSFRVLGIDEKTYAIKPFSIKRAFKKPNDKRVISLTTRSGRRLNLTEDNEVLVCENGSYVWKEISRVKKDDFIAVPNKLPLVEKKVPFSSSFSYVAGLIASDGHISLSTKNAQTSFYNSDPLLISLYKKKLDSLKYTYNTYVRKKGKSSTIRSKEVIVRKDSVNVYNSTKSFAKRLVSFGVPAGDKSSKFALQRKILTYDTDTIASFLRGVFDGDGFVRSSPAEVILTTGMRENAVLFQELLLRLNILSAVYRSTNSWHCSIRGFINVKNFFSLVGTSHAKKSSRFMKMAVSQVKDRIDVLPNSQLLFKNILKKYRWKLGKDMYKYFWNYTKESVLPSKHKLSELNNFLQDDDLARHLSTDILWDRIVSLSTVTAEYVYDFTMEGTNNFIANNIIMHNCIDEMDKMSEEDTSAMHEALEQQTVSISKANIQATLRCETTVLAAANPKFGRFDPYELIAKQINLPDPLINRFDLIFPMKDLPNVDQDNKMASFILNLHRGNDEVKDETLLETKFIRKYVAYAKQHVKPELTDDALNEIQKYYVQMRNQGGEGTTSAVPISARQLEALVRLSEASAKSRLWPKVTKQDAQRAIDLVHYCLSQIGIDPETGKFDIDRITTGITARQRSNVGVVKEVLNELEKAIGKIIPEDDIIREAEIKGVAEDKVTEILTKLTRQGDLFTPKNGFFSKVR